MKLWDKGYNEDQRIDNFTVGRDRELDLRLARYDVEGSMAHITMLQSIGLLTADELEQLLAALRDILDVIDRGEFVIADGIEDVHSQVEFMLTERLGDIGKKIHSGRSRNDQVLVDIKLFMRQEIKNIAEATLRLFHTLQERSEATRDVLMPGYTHMQVAMPSSFGLWFGAYAETLVDDMHMLAAAYRVANQNPLGSAAGYGSSFPLDRELTTRLLHFESLNYNVVAAQMSRGKTERSAAYAIAGLASTVARMAADACMWMCQNFAFISLPKEFTTGSSIMPHKKNPDLFEIIRGKCNILQALPQQVSLLTTNLPLGYNRDLQLLKDLMFPATTEIVECLDMLDLAVKNIQVNTDILQRPGYEHLFTVEEVNRLVLAGVPFRDAYRQVGEQVLNGTFHAGAYTTAASLHHTHPGSLGNLCTAQIAHKMHQAASPFLPPEP